MRVISSFRLRVRKMASKLNTAVVAKLLNAGGGSLLEAGDDDALLNVLSEYFTDNTQAIGKIHPTKN